MTVVLALGVICCLSAASVRAGEKTVDWVTLNNSQGNIFGENGDFGTETNGVWYYLGNPMRIKADTSIENGKFRTLFSYVATSGGWFGAAFTLCSSSTGVKFSEAQTVYVPYHYTSKGGANGKKFLLIVGSQAKSKYFGIRCANTVVTNEDATLTFNISEVYTSYPDNYASVKDVQIDYMCLQPYPCGPEMTTAARESSRGSQRIATGDVFTFGSVTYTWPDSVVYKATFNANGGEAVADMQTDETGALTLPTTTRTGYTLVGWYRNGMCYAAGGLAMLTSDSSYVAGWKNADPTSGLRQLLSPVYRRELDILEANGTCCNLFIGEITSYDPLTDVCTASRTSLYEVDAESVVSGSETNLLLTGKNFGENSGNNWPYASLPVVGLKVCDIYNTKLHYRTTSAKLAGKQMRLDVKVANNWYTVYSTNTMQCSTEDEFKMMKFKVAESLGESTYGKISNAEIREWKLYPYKEMPLPLIKGVTLELGRMILDAEHSSGLSVILR